MVTDIDLDTTHYRVLRLLKENPACRDSDRFLLWVFYKKHHNLDLPLMKLENPVSIIRCRRRIQKLNPALKGNLEVEEQREAHNLSYKKYFGECSGECENGN